jgi:RAQPRD family integrative conjugative element protein
VKIKIMLVISIIITLFSTQVLANDTRERIYLVQMMNQLDSMKPLLIAASKEQAKNSRVQFHYIAYRDSNGNLHNGLLEDINEIKNGIQDKLNKTEAEPRTFQAIKGDYLNLKNIKYSPVGNLAGGSDAK